MLSSNRGRFEERCAGRFSSNRGGGLTRCSPRTMAVRGEVWGKVLLEPGRSRRKFDEVFSSNHGGSRRGVGERFPRTGAVRGGSLMRCSRRTMVVRGEV